MLAAARATGKPVVVDFLGYPPPGRRWATSTSPVGLGEAAELAVALEVGLAGERTGERPARRVAPGAARPPAAT